MSSFSVSDHSNRRVDYVAAMMHELKTSLTAIIASAEIIAEELNLDEGDVHWKLVQSIIRNAHRLNERVTDFAQMWRPEMKDLEFQPGAADLGQIIRDVATRIHPSIQERGQTLALEIPESLPLILGDRHHLEQVLLMLISNAVKFSPEGSGITVGTRRGEPGMVQTSISDRCGGIAQEEREHIFQPNYQIGRTDGKGGLGLSIAKFLVELHGGGIWLESREGDGCSFFFTLPVFGRKQ